MVDIVLNTHTFINGVTASTVSEWYPVDYKYSTDQVRSISGTKADNDFVVLELRTNGVLTTATTWVTGAAPFNTLIQGPFQELRVRKVGALGAATVVGIV